MKNSAVFAADEPTPYAPNLKVAEFMGLIVESESTVASRVARRLGWPASEFPARLFLPCLPRWAVVPALLIRVAMPSVFAADLEVLTDAGNATTAREIRIAAQSLSYNPRRARSFIRDTLGIRCSGRRLLALLRETIGRHLDEEF
jgi:hypothetical protein